MKDPITGQPTGQWESNARPATPDEVAFVAALLGARIDPVGWPQEAARRVGI